MGQSKYKKDVMAAGYVLADALNKTQIPCSVKIRQRITVGEAQCNGSYVNVAELECGNGKSAIVQVWKDHITGPARYVSAIQFKCEEDFNKVVKLAGIKIIGEYSAQNLEIEKNPENLLNKPLKEFWPDNENRDGDIVWLSIYSRTSKFFEKTMEVLIKVLCKYVYPKQSQVFIVVPYRVN
jgi:hypothetical protein